MDGLTGSASPARVCPLCVLSMPHTAFATSSIFATNLSTLKPAMKASAKNPISLAPAFAVYSSTNKPAFKKR